MSFLFLLGAEPPVHRTPSLSDSSLFLPHHSTSLTYFSTEKSFLVQKSSLFLPHLPVSLFKSVPVSAEFG